MRRPTFCTGVATEDDCYCTAALVPGANNHNNNKEEGRLARVKRLLAGTLSIGRRGAGRCFGARLDELPAGREGVPKIVVRLCGYIENYGLRCAGLFRLSGGNPKLVERLRLSFDRTGEADLEATGDPQSVASLLKLWLRELPEPIILSHVAHELLDIQEKFHEDLPEWRAAVSHALLALPEANLRLLHYILRFLHRCQESGRCRHYTSGGSPAARLDCVFTPLLIHDSLVERHDLANELTGKMINEMTFIFGETFVEHAYQAAVGVGHAESCSVEVSGGPLNHQQRKRKERHESFNSQSQERKVIRSNSEERPLENGDKDNIRRVSSHEDFSLNKANNNNNNNNNNGGFLSELIDPTMGHGVRFSQPLHEHNSPAVSRHIVHHKNSEECYEDEHELRRSSERFARAMAPRGRRDVQRRKRKSQSYKQRAEGGSGSSKENEGEEEADGSARNPNQQLTPVSSSTSSDDDVQASGRDLHKSHAFLQLHPQEKERSPSPSSSPSTPHPKLHELLDCSNEPLKSLGHGRGSHQDQVMLSPRNSMVFPRRGGLDPNVPPSPPQEHNPRSGRGAAQDGEVKQMNKQINSIKRKLKRYEEDFERQNGYRPSHADKMADKGVKGLGADLIKLRKEIKLLKEDNATSASLMAKPTGLTVSADHVKPLGVGAGATMEEVLQEVEQHLGEKRSLAGRSENLDLLSREELMDEKVALQKGLLYLESVFGRPVTRGERDVVRPLYDRYRTLKRMVIRTGSSKLKDSISELATILEHETMNFTSQPSASSDQPANQTADAATTLAALTAVNPEPCDPTQLENLHSLPLSKLLDQQRSIREEKKQLRRSLREFEDEFQRRTGKKLQREDRLPMETIYVAYKQAKAKLRLLEALVSKQTSK